MTTGVDTVELPAYPMARAAGSPFDPPPELRAIQRAGRPRKVRLWDGNTAWLVTRFADQRALLRDPRISSDNSRPGFPHENDLTKGMGSRLGFVRADPPEHTRVRRLVTAPFAVRRVQAMRPAVQQITDRLIDDMLAGPRPVDLVQAFALPLPSMVICELLGMSLDGQHASPLPALIDSLEGVLQDKMAAPADDLLSMLAAEVTAGNLALPEAAGIAMVLFVAGHDTTANMIALSTLALLQNPEQLALLRDTDDPTVVDGAVEELLRYLSIAHDGRRRVALADIEVGGEVVRAGEGVIMANDVADRDPDEFPDPDRLDIRRPVGRHLAFAFGVHQCLGQTLARLELHVVYSTLYRRIPALRLATEPDELEFRVHDPIYGVRALPVTW